MTSDHPPDFAAPGHQRNRLIERLVMGVTSDLNSPLTEHSEAEEALARMTQRLAQQARIFDTTLSFITDFAYIFDRDGRFLYANQPLLALWDLRLEDAVGKNFVDLNYPAKLAEKLQRQIQQVCDTGEIVRDETPYTSPTGQTGYYEYIFSPVRAVDGTIEVVAGSTRDITERKQVEFERDQLLASARAARAEAERASQMKDDFLATLSHELRTPLNAILGWSQILQSTAQPTADDLTEGLAAIDRNARAQTQIIEDLLDMSRIISGKVRLDIQQLNLATVLQASLDTMRPAADAKDINLFASADPCSAMVCGDPNRLHQIFWNLISNAIKFTPRGGRVQVMLECFGSHLQVSVIDTGEGIKAEFLPHIFDRFRQVDGSTTRRHGGLGLGLSIVKQLVELHGGSVTVISPGLGQGTTFSVRLPLTVVHEPEKIETGRQPGSASIPAELYKEACVKLKGVRVLVVDDEADARALLKRLLGDCGAMVRTASSAEQAFELFLAETPEVVVSDIGMPDEDGYSLIRRIRALPKDKGGQTPSLALTAYARAVDRMKAVRAGFNMHLVKPVEPVELLTMVASLGVRS